MGYLGINFSEKYGGSEADFFFTVVFLEELGRSGFGGFAAAITVHQYMATAHIEKFAGDYLKDKYLPAAVAGELIGALAITEPNTGSDVASINCSAVKEGDFYKVNGTKLYITNGYYADFITLAVKTEKEAGYGGISLLVVDTNSPGFSATKLDKMGWHCSDTAEISLQDVMVPGKNLIGEENMGFYYIAQCFQVERLAAALTSVGGAKGCIEETLEYMQSRKAFGRPINKFQVLRHRMVDLLTEVEAMTQLSYHACWKHMQDVDAITECSMSKLMATEVVKKVIDECLQVYGGFGYMSESPISRYYRDVRVSTIVGGTSDIMKEIIAKIQIDGLSLSAPESGNRSKETEAGTGTNQTVASKIPKTIGQLLDIAQQRFIPARAEGFDATIHFDFSKDKSGQFTFRVNKGTLSIKEGLHGGASCLVRCKGQTFLDIELGKTSAEKAFLMGRLKVSNIKQMLKFRKLFKRLG